MMWLSQSGFHLSCPLGGNDMVETLKIVEISGALGSSFAVLAPCFLFFFRFVMFPKIPLAM